MHGRKATGSKPPSSVLGLIHQVCEVPEVDYKE
jgi:hypothetical protein